MKKPSEVSFLITLLLAAALCTHGKEFVKDNDGNPVEVGKKYYMLPVKTESNTGGGLVPANTDLHPDCPLGIIQTIRPYTMGTPVSLDFPHRVMETYVPLASAVTIEFKYDNWAMCNEYSKFWKVDDSSSAIVIGGNPEDQNSLFKIEKSGEYGLGANTYKLSTLTGTVGTIPGAWSGSAPQLVVTNDNAKTLPVKFYKVDDSTTTTSLVEKLRLRMFPFY
ncbi:Kunitz trypsin inhibitor 2 [Cardamine amara subsp. amara]|uniref:Kunitz trypsin inhibitor 2 n=1 Tax=Cardamine amara subsp. amara TaxID=228776 RepID=A0ABD0ZYW1_CARAN